MAVTKNKAIAKKKKEVSIVEMVERMKASLEAMAKDCEKFDAGQKAAGGRVRKGMQEIKIQCKGIRDTITEIKNARKES